MLEPTTCQLTKPERVIFNEIVQEREPSHWTAHRRQIAALCAKELHRLEVAQRLLQSEGFVVETPRGDRVVNPLVKVADQALKAVLAYRRSLTIHARALGGEARDIARRHAIRLEQQRDAPIDRDGLIAIPDKDGGDDDRRR